MKKILTLFALAVFGLASCDTGDGYTEYSLVSYSTFEFGTSVLTDSLLLTSSYFSEAASSSFLIYMSERVEEGDELTGGFALSSKRDSSLVLKPDNSYPQYTMFATSAGWESETCAVFYQNESESAMPEHDAAFTYGYYGTCTPSSCLVNNTQLMVYNILSEDSGYTFETGDYLKLTITGTYGTTTTGSVSVYLADYTTLVPTLVTEWTSVNLSALGTVEYIDFTLESTKSGMPLTFCLDNLVSSIYINY